MGRDEPATVLVVEDDLGLARLQRLRLERVGYVVAGATTAAEGLGRIRAGGIDLVVLDQNLPGGVNGLDLYRQMKEAGFSVPAILVTAFDDEAVVLQALRAGVNDFVPKTHDYLDYLLPAIERVLKEARVERQLAESQALLAGVIDSALDAVLTVDEDGRVALFNPAAEQTFRCAAAEALGRPVQRFLPAWPGSAGDGDPSRASYRWDTEGLRADGERLPLELAVSRAEANGRRRWTCIARDVTERRRAEEERARLIREQAARVEAERTSAALRASEQRLRSQHRWLEGVLNLMPVPLLLIEPVTACVLFANRAADGLAGGSFPRGRPADEYHLVYHCTDAGGRRIPDEQMPGVRVSRGERLDGFEMNWHTAGVVRPLLVYADTPPAMHGLPATCVVVFQDVSHLKQIEAELRDSHRRKDEFLATLAHELRNPLAPIRNALAILRLADGDSARLDQARGLMERQVRQMVRLIDDLLDISRITRGKIELRKERVTLAEVVNSAVESSRPLIDLGGHTLTVTLPPRPVHLEADPTRLAQVLLNLLNNAAKYTEPGGRIGLTASLLDSDGRFPPCTLEVRVRDTGIGIPKEMLPRVFDMFTQVERSVDRAQGGLGIGLSLVRGLVQLHGGTVEAHSDGPGRGSEFVVRLPLPAQEPAEARSAAVPPPPGSNGTGGRRRVLVVDDNTDAAHSLAMLLGMMGYETSTANDGPAALREAAAARPDVVLLDIGMPGMSGYEVARELRRTPGLSAALLVAMTGWGQEEDRRRSLEAGFDRHLVKPVDLAALEQILAEERERAAP
ncbi:MAG TPA: response regulator [Gemmataceae bacterium]|nr:response regulator [Gemmataceae bacterium]